MHHEFFQHFHDRKSPKALRVGRWVGLGLALATVFALLFGFVVAWLWNALMPEIFGLGKIGYWQAVGLLVLAKIFFGGAHHGPTHHVSKHHQRTTVCSDDVGRDAPVDADQNAPIPDLPEEQSAMYQHYWAERGKAAFEAYIKEHLDQPPAKDA